MARSPLILTENPAPRVRRLTLNRPEKRNALSNDLRQELFAALETADADPAVCVTIVRGAGPCFSAGYDLADQGETPFYTAGGQGSWARHVVEGCFRIWDLAKPVIAQVHGWCLAGGWELAASCDLVYVADDALIGYPPVRAMAPADNHFHAWMIGMRAAMEHMLTGDSMTGVEATRLGFANRSYDMSELDDRVMERAERIAMVPSEIAQLSKRAVHRQMDVMGIRAGIRAATDIHALGWNTEASLDHMRLLRSDLKTALELRDAEFGDYGASGRSGDQ